MSALKSNCLLLLAAAIWGFAFVAQRVGMDFVGPFTFNGVRFALGSLSLLPLIFYFQNHPDHKKDIEHNLKNTVLAGGITGTILFLGASLQQVGMVYTTAGKAAFITCLYIVIVPMLGIFLKQRLPISGWCGSITAVIGLYLLCVTDGTFSISYGEILELVGAVFWALHILVIDYYS